MEPPKRKRRTDDPNGYPRRRPPPPSSTKLTPSHTPVVIPDDDDDRTVTDEEVEEFFAIVRRIYHASRNLAGRPRAEPVAVARWSPAFALEDFSAQFDAVNEDVERGRSVEDDGEGGKEGPPEPAAAAAEKPTGRFLDLNALPTESEGYNYSETSPGGKATDQSPLVPSFAAAPTSQQ